MWTHDDGQKQVAIGKCLSWSKHRKNWVLDWTDQGQPRNCERKNYRTLFEDQLINTPIVYKYYFSKSLFYFINCIVSHYQNYIYLLLKIENYISSKLDHTALSTRKHI